MNSPHSLSGTPVVVKLTSAVVRILVNRTLVGGVSMTGEPVDPKLVVGPELISTRVAIEVTPAFSVGAPKGPVAWAIAAGASDLVDGNTQ